MNDRKLDWPALWNARDMGGYVLPGGRRTRRGALVRTDGLQRMTPDGVAAAVAYGVHTVIDLRFENELLDKPNPFAAGVGGVRWVHAPLFEYGMTGQDSALREGPQGSAWNIALMTEWRANLARALGAIAAAPADGAVLFHCHAGKDRTGLVALLLGSLAGMAEDDLISDYMESNTHLAELFDMILAKYADDPAMQASVRPKLTGPEEMITGSLRWIRETHGDTARLLSDIGLSTAQIAALRARLA